jgi:predicted phage terminase large subunit-like protein
MSLWLEKTAEVERRRFTADDEKLTAQSFYTAANRDFWAFRKLIRGRGLIHGWWQEDVANQLTWFWRDYKNGKRPKLVLGAPPQHGKSDTMKDFAAWVAGKDPDLKTIFASYADELGIGANLYLQRTIPTPLYQRIFPKTRIAGAESDVVGRPRRTTTFLEFSGKKGSFRNTTVAGQITGHGLDIGVVDDPIKGRAEAQSKPIRDKTWAWLTDDFFSRFSDSAGMVMIMTRWHVDDPVGRWFQRFPNTRVLNYRAIAERDELPHRRVGEALFPEHKSLDFLMERRKALTEASWQSLYQQHPIIVGGGIFPIEKLKTLSIMVDRADILKSVRYWDKAGTEDEGACTAGALVHKMKDGRFVIEHVARGQWGALERERHIKAWAERDRASLRSWSYEVGVEQEPGSGGKESAESTVRNLAGFRVYADKVTGSKEVRAEPLAAQVQNGNVFLVAGSYITELLDEMESFPAGKFRDQVDACTGAFNRIQSGPVYNLFGGAVD